eukprot:CAMPEP_0172577646 /NCGR_PEP_ID=MMETSP1067-20121228/138337_1 /TAXON_ID=265564 ORGANISM="Thalassiosira punctigera, Strain Tpunct2005C2" /NCGR_SAMPLE_ID=MMETSP1067 /ASSEMBLY_ACC=CAM_ASM_000444 /LENGTH=339 /DNA_ID=CAMNT_0013370335 /DNA_START=321 /DNA_END=1336 /DNA_ORIENTATION=+
MGFKKLSSMRRKKSSRTNSAEDNPSLTAPSVLHDMMVESEANSTMTSSEFSSSNKSGKSGKSGRNRGGINDAIAEEGPSPSLFVRSSRSSPAPSPALINTPLAQQQGPFDEGFVLNCNGGEPGDVLSSLGQSETNSIHVDRNANQGAWAGTAAGGRDPSEEGMAPSAAGPAGAQYLPARSGGKLEIPLNPARHRPSPTKVKQLSGVPAGGLPGLPIDPPEGSHMSGGQNYDQQQEDHQQGGKGKVSRRQAKRQQKASKATALRMAMKKEISRHRDSGQPASKEPLTSSTFVAAVPRNKTGRGSAAAALVMGGAAGAAALEKSRNKSISYDTDDDTTKES